MEEKKGLLPPRHSTNVADTIDVSDEEDWSDDDSSSDYSTDNSSIPEWESAVNEYTGEVLYIDCHPFVTQSNTETRNDKISIEPFVDSNTRRSTRGKFLRLIRRRESKRASRRHNFKSQDPEAVTSNKVKFQDLQEGEEREVTLKVESSYFHNSGRKTPPIERMLGICVSTLSDGHRLMIAGFSPASDAKKERNIKIGDWLKSINNKEITSSNLNVVLEQISESNEVLLKLQRVAGVEVTKDPPVHELNHQSNFVKDLISVSDKDEEIFSVLYKYPLGLVYLNTDNLSESSQEYEDVVYCFPHPAQRNVLCHSRGVFTTLNHLMNDIVSNKPLITSAVHKDQLAHVAYTSTNGRIMLLMLPASCISVEEMLLLNIELVRLFEFKFSSLENCFMNEKNMHDVNHFLVRFSMKILNDSDWTTTQEFLEIFGSSNNCLKRKNSQLENVLPAVAILNLPKEAQMQIDDALTELEASDYREWNEEPLDCQRLFTILGSALYYKGYLLASHFMYEDLLDIHCYCRQEGFHHLTVAEPLKSLVLWREVYPSSCRGLALGKNLDCRRYLLIVGSGKDLLVTIMEAGGCTEDPEDNMGPDAFYVEEVQATLAHINELGLFEVADKLLAMHSRTQVTIPGFQSIKRKSDLLGNINFLKTNYSGVSKDLQKKPEVTSILKRRGSDQVMASQSSLANIPSEENSDIHSEDSVSQSGCSAKSEYSDESSFLGKRLQKERNKYESDEESDNDDFEDASQMSSSSFDVSDVKQALLSEVTDMQPIQITSGNENVLFYYIHLDVTEKILICPPIDKREQGALEFVLNTFRICCQKIHGLFENTIRFRKMSCQDMAKSVINKSLIAIKEHGVVFEYPYAEDKDLKKHKIKFWVVGRLFHMPHPKEVYVCYQEDIPQNLIELAFKITLNVTI